MVPLLNRIKTRIPEGELSKIVSDEDSAIIGAVAHVLPDVSHSFCFHQLENVTRKYLDEFASIDNIPLHELVLYELANDLILAESVIESTVCYKKIMKLASGRSCQKHRKMWFHMLKKYILITGNCWRKELLQKLTM